VSRVLQTSTASCVYVADTSSPEDDDDGESSDDSVDSKDNEDPMAAYIKAERKGSSSKHASTSGKLKDKKRRHDGETKEERRARKAAKRAKKEREGKKKTPAKGKGKEVKEEGDEYMDLARQFGGGQERQRDTARDDRPRDRTRDIDDRERSLPSLPSRRLAGRDHDDRYRSYDGRNRVGRHEERMVDRRDRNQDRDYDYDYDYGRDGDRRRDDGGDRRR
jgi:RNA-binding motif protein, X-linked 2